VARGYSTVDMDVLDYLLKVEKDGEEYYRGLAEKATNPGFKRILTMLADDEARHYQAIEDMAHSGDTGMVRVWARVWDLVQHRHHSIRIGTAHTAPLALHTSFAHTPASSAVTPAALAVHRAFAIRAYCCLWANVWASGPALKREAGRPAPFGVLCSRYRHPNSALVGKVYLTLCPIHGVQTRTLTNTTCGLSFRRASPLF
jgi:hypothetical protein